MRRSIVSMVLIISLLLVSSMVAVAQDDRAQSNKQTYLDAVGQYNSGNREAFYNMVTDPFMMNQADATLYETSPDVIQTYYGALAAAMPDMQMNADVVIAQGEWVAVEMTFTGTFTEALMFPPFGLDPIQPNNEPVTWTEMDFLHFNADNLVDTLWVSEDRTVLFGQMGIFPPQDAGDSAGTPLEQPAGYQNLSADELAVTFTSGMEERNLSIQQEQVDGGLFTDSSPYYTNPYVTWNGGVPYAEEGEAVSSFFGLVTSAMPDTVLKTPVVVAEGDWVAFLGQISGTFTEDVDYMGTTLSSTGEPIAWQVGIIDRYDADGLIVEEWSEADVSPLLQGLGLMPKMGG